MSRENFISDKYSKWKAYYGVLGIKTVVKHCKTIIFKHCFSFTGEISSLCSKYFQNKIISSEFSIYLLTECHGMGKKYIFGKVVKNSPKSFYLSILT